VSFGDLLAAPLPKRLVIDEQFAHDGEQSGRLATLPSGETVDGIRQGTFSPREHAHEEAGQLKQSQRVTRQSGADRRDQDALIGGDSPGFERTAGIPPVLLGGSPPTCFVHGADATTGL
jgi:hypothetical protein